MPAIVVLGDVNIDIIAHLESYPALGGDAQPLSTVLMLGGTSLNTAIVLQRLGIDVALVARVGRDLLGDFATAEMERSGLSAQWIQRDEVAPTGLAYVAVTPDGQRTMLGGGGANRNLDVSALPLDIIQQAQWLHLTSYTLLDERARATTLKALQVAQSHGVMASLDVGMAPQRLVPLTLTNVARQVDILFPTGETRYPRSAGQWIVRKHGSSGCMVEPPDGNIWPPVPAFVVDVVDTTGAGDAFNGGFIAGRVSSLDMRASALLGNACGALAVTVNGAGNSFSSRAALLTLLRERAPAGWADDAQRIVHALQ